MYYGGDSSSTLQTLSYTCSYCGQIGFSISLLLEHIRASHGTSSGPSSTEVVGVDYKNNNNNNNYDIYSAVIVAAQPLQEFTRFTR